MGLFTSRQRKGAQRPIRKLYAPDRIGIVGFHDRGFVIAKPAEPHAAWLQQRSQQLHTKIGGLTNMTDGLRNALMLLRRTPPGVLRRIWLLSDGEPTMNEASLFDVVDEARSAYCNINAIGFGDQFNEGLLRQIAGRTHNGKFVAVRTLRELTDALIANGGGTGHVQRRHHRSETTILAIDLSGSMTCSMGDRTKVAVVEEAVLRLLLYKQQCFA